jgi:uncharacterized protein
MKPSAEWIEESGLRVYRIQADVEGPSVAITANLHGDECGGISVIHRLLARLPLLLARGVVHLYPSLNPEGLKNGTRVFPRGSRDLNRCFPGKRTGSPAERHLWFFWEDLKSRKPAALIDLHADSGDSVPYVLVDRLTGGRGGSKLLESCWELAAQTAFLPLMEYPLHLYKSYNLDKSLTGAVLNRLRIPAVTLEVGPRRRIDGPATDAAFGAVLRILFSLGMVSLCPKYPGPPPPPGVWRRAKGPLASKDGVFVPIAPLGAPLPRGYCIGSIFDPFGEAVEMVGMPEDGLVVSFPDRAYVKKGQSCSTVAVLE